MAPDNVLIGVLVATRHTTWPSLSSRNLVKFHSISALFLSFGLLLKILMWAHNYRLLFQPRPQRMRLIAVNITLGRQVTLIVVLGKKSLNFDTVAWLFGGELVAWEDEEVDAFCWELIMELLKFDVLAISHASGGSAVHQQDGMAFVAGHWLCRTIIHDKIKVMRACRCHNCIFQVPNSDNFKMLYSRFIFAQWRLPQWAIFEIRIMRNLNIHAESKHVKTVAVSVSKFSEVQR